MRFIYSDLRSRKALICGYPRYKICPSIYRKTVISYSFLRPVPFFTITRRIEGRLSESRVMRALNGPHK